MELLLLFLLALLLLGPEEIPPLARLINRTLNELKTIFHRLEREWNLNPKKTVFKTNTPLADSTTIKKNITTKEEIPNTKKTTKTNTDTKANKF